MAGRTKVIVYDTQIAKLFDQGENAVEFLKDVIDSILARAENIEVPRGNAQSGRIRQGWNSLARSHKSSGVLRRGIYGAGGSAYNDAPHARWVHEGVEGRIYPTSSSHLAIPVPVGTPVLRQSTPTGPYGYKNRKKVEVPARRGFILVPSVAGQEANPWLARAGNAVVAEYRAKRYYRNWTRGGTRLTAGMGRV